MEQTSRAMGDSDTAQCEWIAVALGAVALLACGGGSEYCMQREDVTDAEICFQPNPADCGLMRGCRATPACISNGCLLLERPDCDNKAGCVWVESLGCRSTDGHDGCVAFDDWEACATLDNCTWDVTCTGHPKRVNCEELDDPECARERVQCEWYEYEESPELTPGDIIGL